MHATPAVSARRGFTLVEAIVATLLLTIALLALASTLGNLVRSLTAAGAISAATHEARSTLERARVGACTPPPSESAITRVDATADASVALSHGAVVDGAATISLHTGYLCERQ